ncbi:DH domain-containing protein [Favolaschia claudopus]|uniref:DH domain-containing protein n=1 Tax=Favolaschia claudopus TaxID=2862362 RepID=A0AAW0EBX3_9AGAR
MPPDWRASGKQAQAHDSPFASLLATIMSIRDRRALRHSPKSADYRLSISGFLPMPSITASPVCTPTSPMANGEEIFRAGSPRAGTSSSSSNSPDLSHLLLHIPTWIATPPTPPSINVIRRSATSCGVGKHVSPLSHSSSFPVIASDNPTPRRSRATSESLSRRPSLPRRDATRVSNVSSPESELGSESDDAGAMAKAKDDVRKYHALMELLSTEVSYLADLRALFTIYLRHLPSLSRSPSGGAFSRGSSSRNSSYTQLPKSSVLSDQGLHPLTTLQTKPKSSSRSLFTNTEVDLLTRNAEEVLQLHENFVEELRAALLPLRFPMEISAVGPLNEKELIANIDAAIGEVATKFATDASRFDAYQTFCTGHTAALQLVHRAQHQHPFEWEAYEQLCASLIANMSDADTPDSMPESLRSPESATSSDNEERSQSNKLRKRTTSLTSLDGAVRRVRSRANSKESSLEGGRDRHHSRRLAFLDYMIKPIQRICKYPLLLDQLRPGKTLRAMSHPGPRPRVHVVVESAAQAMRHVASAVDEARHRAEVKMQSALIVSRIALVDPASATSHMSSGQPTVQILTSSFLSSLGICLLAGSLDVMHHQSSKPPSNGTNINAKYLGAFLYIGGYLILVKVTKGKVYDPRHWFRLGEFNVIDSEEEDTSLPCTFSLICKGHQFDLTAACQREKDAWLSSIRESQLHPPTWINEPTPSIHCDGKGDLVPSTLDGGPFEMMNALPTIQSLPELAKDDEEPPASSESASPSFSSQTQIPAAAKAADVPSSNKSEPTHSRRSSANSVKAIFSPGNSDSDTIVIRRSLPTARATVDQGLQDVVSAPILAARSYATARDEIFQAPKALRASASFARSSSALSLSGLTMNRLTICRHESVRVPRKKSLADDGLTFNVSPSPRGTQRKRPRRLSIVSTSEPESFFQPPSDLSVSPFSQCSSLLSSTTSPFASPPVSDEQPRPSESAPALVTSPLPSPASQRSIASTSDHYRTLTQSLLKRWSKGPRHRRSRSAPHDQNVPEGAMEDSSPSEQSPGDYDGAPLQLVVSPDSMESPDSLIPSPSDSPTKGMRFLSSDAPTTFRHSSAENTVPRSGSKKGSIFKRLKGLSPHDQAPAS